MLRRRVFAGALWRFAELVQIIHPKKIRAFFEHLLPAFRSIAERPEELIHEKLPDYYDMIFRVFGPSINDKETKVRSIEEEEIFIVQLDVSLFLGTFSRVFSEYVSRIRLDSSIVRCLFDRHLSALSASVAQRTLFDQ